MNYGELSLAHMDGFQLETGWEEETHESNETRVLEDIDEVGHSEGSHDGKKSNDKPQKESEKTVKPVFWFFGSILSRDNDVEVVDDCVGDQRVCRDYINGREKDEVVRKEF